ncbi:ComF family protein [Streptomyces specialis]|uniref:ComF family protein n=1 Tax=Streptomyces specialis TaxID=498367 RepID=UPI00073F62B4|nr:phosphoribosyltransferase family protein [Streptomyces specialis]
MFTGDWYRVICDYKYSADNQGWAIIFGRLIVGWLEQHAADVQGIDLIIGNPTSPARQPHQHIEGIMAAADIEDQPDRWPLAPKDEPFLTKRNLTTTSAVTGTNWHAKMQAAQEHARELELHGDARGKRILLVDDTCTTGAQMHTVGAFLRKHGAREVRGLVLARVPWGYRP